MTPSRPQDACGDPEETLAELFARRPAAAAAFWARGMRCPGCPIAPFHTLADACAEYDVDAAARRAEIRAAAEEEEDGEEDAAEASLSPPRPPARPGGGGR